MTNTSYRMYQPVNVAYWLLKKANQNNQVLSGSSIHTLTYFAEAWTYTILRQNLFISPEPAKTLCLATSNGIEYEELLDVDINTSAYPQTNFEKLIIANKTIDIDTLFEPNINQILKDIWCTYSDLSGNELKVHAMDNAPYKLAYHFNRQLNTRMSKQIIFDYYNSIRLKNEHKLEGNTITQIDGVFVRCQLKDLIDQLDHLNKLGISETWQYIKDFVHYTKTLPTYSAHTILELYRTIYNHYHAQLQYGLLLHLPLVYGNHVINIIDDVFTKILSYKQ